MTGSWSSTDHLCAGRLTLVDTFFFTSDIFFFDYGVVACWGMTKHQVRECLPLVIHLLIDRQTLYSSQENTVVRGIAAQVQGQPLDPTEIEIDEFQFHFSATEKPHVQNDTVTLHRKYTTDHKMKLAISYALSQSVKLSVYENRVVDIVEETKNLPESLALSGQVDISSKDIAKLIGKIFLQKSAVNLQVQSSLTLEPRTV